MPRPVHFELPADDPERIARFYGDVFGWTVQKWDGPMDYWFLMTGPDEEPGIHGAFARRGEGETGTVNTISVPDLDASLAKVLSGGGTVLRGRSAVPTVGYMAMCQDTEGNVFGLMQFDASAGA